MRHRRVGVVGIGAMGAAMARRLRDSGYELAVYDKNPSKLAEFAERQGVRVCSSPAEVTALSAVVLLMVATADQLRDVAFSGESAVLQAITAEKAVVVTATVGRTVLTELAEALGARAGQLVDAPVSGGVSRAESGSLLMMVSAADTGLSRAREVLGTLASELVVCGPSPGDGQDFKLVNQVLCGVHLLAAAEALAFAEKLGIDPLEALRVLPSGAAASFMLVDRGWRMVEEAPDVKSALSIMAKDMNLVSERASEVHARTPLSNLSLDLLREGMRRKLELADDSQVIELFRQWPTASNDVAQREGDKEC